MKHHKSHIMISHHDCRTLNECCSFSWSLSMSLSRLSLCVFNVYTFIIYCVVHIIDCLIVDLSEWIAPVQLFHRQHFISTMIKVKDFLFTYSTFGHLAFSVSHRVLTIQSTLWISFDIFWYDFMTCSYFDFGEMDFSVYFFRKRKRERESESEKKLKLALSRLNNDDDNGCDNIKEHNWKWCAQCPVAQLNSSTEMKVRCAANCWEKQLLSPYKWFSTKRVRTKGNQQLI